VSLRLSTASRRTLVAALLISLVSVHLWIGVAARRAREDDPLPGRDESIYLPPTPVLHTLALGRHTFMADLVWLRAISYFAVEFTGNKDFRWLVPLTEAVLELDPDFRRVYQWAATVTMYGGRLDNGTVRASSRVLEHGIERFPDDWELHFQLGTNYYFELKTTDPEQRREWRRIGAAHIESAANLPGAPDWLSLTVASMHKRTGRQELAIRHLEEVYLRVSDEGMRAQIGAQLATLKNRQSVETLESERKSFEADWRAAFPYVPQELFVLLGAQPDGRVDRVWELAEGPKVDEDGALEASRPPP